MENDGFMEWLRKMMPMVYGRKISQVSGKSDEGEATISWDGLYIRITLKPTGDVVQYYIKTKGEDILLI